MKPRRPVIQFYVSLLAYFTHLIELALQTHCVRHVIIILLSHQRTAMVGKINVIRVHLFVLASLLLLIYFALDVPRSCQIALLPQRCGSDATQPCV